VEASLDHSKIIASNIYIYKVKIINTHRLSGFRGYKGVLSLFLVSWGPRGVTRSFRSSAEIKSDMRGSHC